MRNTSKRDMINVYNWVVGDDGQVLLVAKAKKAVGRLGSKTTRDWTT